jgi:hypothetical protein
MKSNYQIIVVENYNSNNGNSDTTEHNYKTLAEAKAEYKKLLKGEYKEHGKTCEVQLWKNGAGKPIESEYQVSALIPKGSIIVTYQHVTYMNYAYKVTDVQEVRSGERYEDLNVSVDHTNSSWDAVFDSIEELNESYEKKYGIFAKLNSGRKIIEDFLAKNGIDKYQSEDDDLGAVAKAITTDNYFKEVEKIGVSELPEPLRKGHDFVTRATNSGAKWSSGNAVIDNTVRRQVEKLNEWKVGQKPKEPTDKRLEELRTVFKSIKKDARGYFIPSSANDEKYILKKFKEQGVKVEHLEFVNDTTDLYDVYLHDEKPVSRKPENSGHNPQKKAKDPVSESIEKGYEKAKKEAKKAKRPRVEKTKKVGSSGLPVEHISPAVNFIKRFTAMSGKQVSYDKLMALLRSLQKAITEKIIRSADKYAEEIKEIQTFLVARANENVETFAITIGEARLEKFQKIIGSETKMLIVTLLKQYISLVGKKDVKEKAEALLKRIKKYEDNEDISSKDKYYNFLEVAVKRMKEYVSGKEHHIKPTIAELNGLAGIGCDCNSALGMIYDINKPLRKTKDRKYTDAKGRGAGSHHGGVTLGAGGWQTEEDYRNERNRRSPRDQEKFVWAVVKRFDLSEYYPNAGEFIESDIKANDLLSAVLQNGRTVIRVKELSNGNVYFQLLSDRKNEKGGRFHVVSGVGTIYDIKKSLRRTGDKKYTDAKGRGAGSHHGGVQLGSAMSIDDILAVEHTPIGLEGKWKELIGEACKPMNILMYGKGGSGKSGMALAFSQYLSEKGHPVLYVAGESFGTPVFKQLIMDAGIKGNDKFSIVPDLKGHNLAQYDFVVLDSKDSLKLDIEQFRSLKKNHPKLSFIVLSQGKKDGDYRGSEEWRNEVDTLINFPERGKASTADDNGKNRWGGCAVVQLYEPKKA